MTRTQAPAAEDTQVGPLLREDFPPLPEGVDGWVLRQRSATVYVDDRPDTEWPVLLEFLNRFPCCWTISPNMEVAS